MQHFLDKGVFRIFGFHFLPLERKNQCQKRKKVNLGTKDGRKGRK